MLPPPDVENEATEQAQERTTRLTHGQVAGLNRQLAPVVFHMKTPHSAELAPLMLTHTIAAPVVAISNIRKHPGDRFFYTWFCISTYIPILAACIGPVANMLSIVALIERWRSVTAESSDEHDHPSEISDEWRVMVLNAVSLASGVVGNIAFFGNFTGRLRYSIAILTSIFCWYASSGLLLAAIFVTRGTFTPQLVPSEGFYTACFTCGFYFLNGVLLSVNYFGAVIKMYPFGLNLNSKQRTLMVFTISFCVWCMVGCLSMRKLIGDITYSSALYYCLVSYFTIGLGDITAHNDGGKAVALLLSLGGTLLLALIVTNIRSVVMSIAGPTLSWDGAERRRRRTVKKYEEKHIEVTFDSSYHKMRRIQRKSDLSSLRQTLITELCVFCVFWFVGATVFYTVEDWDYFTGIYFCFLCLLTIGYGDYAPKSNLGRVFFCVWTIAAVPMMTIIISNMGDKLYSWSDFFTQAFRRVWWGKMQRKKPKVQGEQPVWESASESDSDSDSDSDSEQEMASHRGQEVGADDEMRRNSSDTISVHSPEPEPDKPLWPLENPPSSGDSAGSVEESKETHSLETPKKLSYTKEWRRICEVLQKRIRQQSEQQRQLLEYIAALTPLIRDSADHPDKRYSLEAWHKLFRAVQSPGFLADEVKDIPVYEEDPWMWLGERSPLRVPIREPNFMMMKLYSKIELDLVAMQRFWSHEDQKLTDYLNRIQDMADEQDAKRIHRMQRRHRRGHNRRVRRRPGISPRPSRSRSKSQLSSSSESNISPFSPKTWPKPPLFKLITRTLTEKKEMENEKEGEKRL
ncbi:hypothetical protein DIURU_001614 [Diutina rugosa]|uniref:Potassium channel domain-containing protein n=1 Tax=Diutina rugosa TaxID=5481 RepID=A0A642UT93_DIURU|nr:uncharacterized protein DIURU_001614 [Diutina rugosa]KAA8905186.1 hypothetical protein DIURU_001614 [Diutina rugosa]